MSANMKLHNFDDKQAVHSQYAKAYAAIVALGGNSEATNNLIRFIQKLEMHHGDSVEALCEIHSALRGNALASTRWHEQMNEMSL